MIGKKKFGKKVQTQQKADVKVKEVVKEVPLLNLEEMKVAVTALMENENTQLFAKVTAGEENYIVAQRLLAYLQENEGKSQPQIKPKAASADVDEEDESESDEEDDEDDEFDDEDEDLED